MAPRWYKTLLGQRDHPSAAFEFTQKFLSASISDRTAIVNTWNAQLAWALPNPWRLACTSEAPGSPQERILVDLLFQALGFSQGDSRESIMGLAVVFNSARLAGLEPRSIFEEVAQAVPGPARDALIAFARRDPEDQSMAAFMLTAVEDPGGGYEIKADW